MLHGRAQEKSRAQRGYFRCGSNFARLLTLGLGVGVCRSCNEPGADSGVVSAVSLDERFSDVALSAPGSCGGGSDSSVSREDTELVRPRLKGVLKMRNCP